VRAHRDDDETGGASRCSTDRRRSFSRPRKKSHAHQCESRETAQPLMAGHSVEQRLPLESTSSNERSTMITDALRTLPPDCTDRESAVLAPFRLARSWVHETTCAMFGHDYLLHAADHRIFLECAVCGHETPGWRIGATVDGRRSSGRGPRPGSYRGSAR